MPETDPAPAPESYSTPRWVKVLGMIALVIIALILLLMLIRSSGGHGPAADPHPPDAVAVATPMHGPTV